MDKNSLFYLQTRVTRKISQSLMQCCYYLISGQDGSECICSSRNDMLTITVPLYQTEIVRPDSIDKHKLCCSDSSENDNARTLNAYRLVISIQKRSKRSDKEENRNPSLQNTERVKFGGTGIKTTGMTTIKQDHTNTKTVVQNQDHQSKRDGKNGERNQKNEKEQNFDQRGNSDRKRARGKYRDNNTEKTVRTVEGNKREQNQHNVRKRSQIYDEENARKQKRRNDNMENPRTVKGNDRRNFQHDNRKGDNSNVGKEKGKQNQGAQHHNVKPTNDKNEGRGKRPTNYNKNKSRSHRNNENRQRRQNVNKDKRGSGSNNDGGQQRQPNVDSNQKTTGVSEKQEPDSHVPNKEKRHYGSKNPKRAYGRKRLFPFVKPPFSG